MVVTKEDLYDRLVNQAGFDKDEVDSFFSVYSLKDWLTAINAGDLTVYRLEQKIDEWLNYENPMDESTTLTEGWTSAYEWQSADDVRDALKEEEISSDWKFVKNFGNFFCYQRKDGRPLVCYYLIQKMGNREWGYKDIGVYPGMKYNAGAAAWLKNALTEYGSTAIEPGDFKGYWDWIEEGNTNKDKVSDMKNQLKAGDKVEIHGHVVIFERPYNKQAFAGHVEDENETYKWYYREIEKVLTESMRENMEDYIMEQQDYINGLCDENGFNVFFDEDTLSGVIEKDGKEVDVQFEIDGDVVTANGVEIYEFFDSFDEDIDADFGVRQFEDPDDLEESISLLESAGYRVVHNEELDEAINNPDDPATSRQLWALFCMTKKDYRGKGLTKQQASDLIGELKSGKKIEDVGEKNQKEDENALVKVGDIYHRHWGYDMSINTYYKVLMVRGKKATVVELGKKVISGCLQQGKVVPDEKNRETKTTIALIKPDGSLRIRFMGDGNYDTYHKWDGQPDYEDHMD